MPSSRRSTSKTDNGPDLSEAQARLDAGDPTFDPLGDLGPVDDLPRDRSRSNRYSLASTAPRRGPLFALPAGDATATFRTSVGNDWHRQRSDHRRTLHGIRPRSNSLLGAANLDLPVAKRSSAIGRLTANANGSVTHLSDFGTITTVGAGLNWSPVPAAQPDRQLDPGGRAANPAAARRPADRDARTSASSISRPARRCWSTTLTGGNPDLLADTRNVLKIGGNWQPFEKTDLRLRAEYVRQTIDDPQGNVSAASEALEAAFPERFVRDESADTLVAVDLRPVNFRSRAATPFRWGFDFTKPLRSRPPSQAAIAAFRERFAGQRGTGPAAALTSARGRPGKAAGPGGGEGGFRGFAAALAAAAGRAGG